MRPDKSEYWKIPEPQSAEFVCPMEDVLSVYCRPYDPKRPVICMDESPKALIGEVRRPLPARPGDIQKTDDEYIRLGVAELMLAIEPLTGLMRVDVLEHRTKKDWARFIKSVVDDDFPDAEKIVLVMDNLNTHKLSSLYETFEPAEAKRIADKLEPHSTPKHGSWLNIAEIGFSCLKRQSLKDRIDSIDKLRDTVGAYLKSRNSKRIVVNWQFKTADARIKLKHLYPVIEEW